MFETFPAISSGILGLIVGSFLNVVVSRFPWEEETILKPRGSRCPSCKTPVAWKDNIPLLSYALLRGKCRHCSTRISPRYPVIEAMTGLLFLASALKFGVTPMLVVRDFPFIALLVAVTFIDLEHRLIPDIMSLGGLALGLITSFGMAWVGREPEWQSAFIGAGFGFGFFYALSWCYWKITGRVGLGGGDIKLLAMIGAFLGPAGVFCSILISSVFGSLVGIIWALAARRRNLMTFAIPYGPFLVVGALYYYLLGDVLWLRFTIPT